MFKDYKSKPITRSAHQITKSDRITKVEGEESTYIIFCKYKMDIKFKAHEKVNIGDYVIYLTDGDIYHCPKRVFEERNIISKD